MDCQKRPALLRTAAMHAAMPMLALDPMVTVQLRLDAPVAIGVSGGADSQAATLATIDYLDQIGHRGPRILVHSDLGVVEWEDSLPACERLARHLGIELLVLRRQAGDMMDRWEARWASSQRRYVDLETVTVVLPWSTPDMRFCTSELKTHLIMAALKKRWPGRTIVNVTGIRREESVRRAKGSIADRKDEFVNWRPLSNWTHSQVRTCIAAAGLALHAAYILHGMSRVSCRFCIMSNDADMRNAARAGETHSIYRRQVQLEIDSTFGFQSARWLGDVAPELLSPAMRRALAAAKRKAIERARIEAALTTGIRYVDGWPTRMLTDAEADLLAGVRRAIGTLMDLPVRCTTREEIHGRYAELLAKKAARPARRSRAR